MEDTYSSWTGLIYIFNLIVGTGALTLPAAFFRSGWALGSILMCILAFVSYVTATFVVETMATTNALVILSKMKQLRQIRQYLNEANQQQQQQSGDQGDSDDDEGYRTPTEESPLTGSIQNFPPEPLTFFTTDNKVEMAEMAGMLFSRGGRLAFFICLTFYLYGDLSIYAAAIGQSLVNALCSGSNFTDPDDRACWPDQPYSTLQAYRFFLFVFLILFGPLVFFNTQKTKYLQIITTITRWLAFTVMISLTAQRLLNDSLPHNSPQPLVIAGFPSLLSSCVYAFMCHHSLPALLSPIRDKNHLHSSLTADYLLVLAFYLILAVPGTVCPRDLEVVLMCLGCKACGIMFPPDAQYRKLAGHRAVFAFPKINNLFSLNFVPMPGDSMYLKVAEYFLILFPVFTLTASFPIISVTLRNNLQSTVPSSRSLVLQKGIIPLAAVIPPVIFAACMPNLEILVGMTGSYAGVGIQYIIPAALVLAARHNKPRELAELDNPFSSPFKGPAWPLLVILWAVICTSFVTVHIISNHLAS